MAHGAADLADLGVLVTRPAHQAASFCRAIESRGGRAVLFPALEIRPVADDSALAEPFGRLAVFDVAVFISANAVIHALPWIRRAGGLPQRIRLAAVGNATAAALARDLRAPDILPRIGFDSEALLACPEMREVKDLSILIVRGEGGRSLLGDTLRDRGAEVVYAEVYRRACPDADPALVLQQWDRIQVVTATSGELLENLLRIFGPDGREALLSKPLLVISARMAEQALTLGFAEVIRAAHAQEQPMLEALAGYAARR